MQARRAAAPLSAEHLHDLVLLTTGDKAAAERAFNAFRAEELRRGETPA